MIYCMHTSAHTHTYHTQVDELEHEASQLCAQLREVLTINKQLEHTQTTLERQLSEASRVHQQHQEQHRQQLAEATRAHQQELAEVDAAARAASGRVASLEMQVSVLEQEKMVGDGGGVGSGECSINGGLWGVVIAWRHRWGAVGVL